MAREIDLLKKDESLVLSEINEMVESLRAHDDDY